MSLDRSLMEKYFLKKLPGRIPGNECLDLLLAKLGEKNGALVMGPDAWDRKLLEKFCEDLDLEYLYVEGESRSFLDRVLRRDTRLLKGGFFVTREPGNLEKLKESEGRFYGFSDETVGRFLGYPEEAVSYFVKRAEDGSVEVRTEKLLDELLGEGRIEKEDASYLELLSFIPCPEKERVMDAIEIGKQREKALLELDERLGTDIGRRYLEEVLRESVYSSECSSASRP